MELSEIKFKYFRRFDQFTASFVIGLNIIKGPNEAGKSTLQDAIVTGFFDRPTGKAREQRYQQWGRDRLYEIELTYQLDAGSEYTLKKDYQAGSLELIGPEGVDTTWSSIQSEIERAMGTSSEKLFLSTASIRQDAMADLGEGRVEISGQLQRIVMGTDAEVEDILNKLQTAIKNLERGVTTRAPVNPGEIKKWTDQLADLDREIDTVRPTVDRRERAQEEIDQFRERLDELEGELRTLLDVQERYQKRRELMGELEEQASLEAEVEARLQKVRAAIEAKAAAEEKLAKHTLIRQLDSNQVSELQEANENLKAKSTEAQVRESDLQEMEKIDDEPPVSGPRKPWLEVLAGAVLGLSGAIALQNPELDPIGLLLIISGVGVVLFGVARFFIQGRRSGVRDASVVLERERLLERHQEGIRGVEEAEKRLDDQLKSIGLTSWGEFEDRQSQIGELEGEIESAKVTLAAVLGEAESMEDLERDRKQASRARRDRQESLEELEDVPDLSATEYAELVNTLSDLQAERENLNTHITRREAILDEPSRTIEDLHQLEERKATTQRALERSQEQAEVYHLIEEGLKQAREETLRTAKDELEPRLGVYLKQMTQGKYATAFVDDELAIRVTHEGRDEPVPVEELSRGTQDQVYLAARLALSDLVFHDARPPLLMDDPFVTFDPQRRQAALELCKSLATDRQIILFTCHEGYAEYADNLIELS